MTSLRISSPVLCRGRGVAGWRSSASPSAFHRIQRRRSEIPARKRLSRLAPIRRRSRFLPHRGASVNRPGAIRTRWPLFGAALVLAVILPAFRLPKGAAVAAAVVGLALIAGAFLRRRSR